MALYILSLFPPPFCMASAATRPCWFCGKATDMVCTGCHTAPYCNEECRPYSRQQQKMIYARGGHITKGGHARDPHGKKFKGWPSV